MARKAASRTKKWDVQVSGLEEIAELFESMPNRARRAAEKAVVAAGKPIADRAGSLAPVGRAGNLQNSIVVEGPLTGAEAESGFGGQSFSLGAQGIDGAMVKIGPDKLRWYGIFAELGTSHHSAQPFMRPAFDEMKNLSVRAVGELMFRALV